MAEFNQEQLALLKDRLIEELGLQTRDLTCLKRMHINTIGDLLKMNKSEMILLDTLGKLSVEHIEERLYVYTVTSDTNEPIEKATEDIIPSSPSWDPLRKNVEKDNKKDPLDVSILDLEIGNKAYYALRFSNLDTIREIVSKDKYDLRKINRKRFSDEIIEDIKKSIKEYAVQHHIEAELEGCSLFEEDQYTETFVEEGHLTETQQIKAPNRDDSVFQNVIDEKDRYKEDVNEEILARLADKYKTRKLSTVKAFFDENPDISSFKLYYYARMHSESSVRDLLVSLGIIEPNNEERVLTDEEQLKEIVDTLRERYSHEKALSLTQIKDENPDISFSKINPLTKVLFNKTAKEYLIEQELIIPEEKDTRTSSEKLEEITNILIGRYENKPKAQILKQLFDDNADINLNSVNTWTREIYGITAREYYARIGVMTSISEAEIDIDNAEPKVSAAEPFGKHDEEKHIGETTNIDSEIVHADINGLTESLTETVDEAPLDQKEKVYDPLRASILDLRIKGRTYYSFSTCGFDTVLKVLQSSKSSIETEYPNISRDMILEIDKAIRQLTSEHGCQKLVLSFPFFANKNPDDNKERSNAVAVDSNVTRKKTSLEEIIIEILETRDANGYEWTSAGKVAEEFKIAYPEIASKVTPRDIVEVLSSTEGIIKNDLYYKYRRTNETPEDERHSANPIKHIAETKNIAEQQSEIEEAVDFTATSDIRDDTDNTIPMPVQEEIENGREDGEISDVPEDAPNDERDQVDSNPPEHRVKFFSWEKDDEETRPTPVTVDITTQVGSEETEYKKNEKNSEDNKDEETQSETEPQPAIRQFVVRHVIANDYSQERIEEIKDIPIEALDLSVRSYNCLKREGINTVWGLIQLSSDDVLSIRNMGHLSHEEVITKTREFMENFNVSAYLEEAQYQRQLTKNEIIDVRNIPIHMLGLSIRSYNCLKRAHIKTLGEVLNKTQAELFTLRNLGANSLEEIVRIAKEVLEKDDSTVDLDSFALFRSEAPQEPENETDSTVAADTVETAGTIEESLADEEPISIREAIKVLPKGYQWAINCRLDGLTLSEIADKGGVTRQRIEQIVRKGVYAVFHGTRSIKPINSVTEDKDKELFEQYNISLAEWTEHLHKPEYAYHYLKIRYKKGDKPLPGSGSHKSNNKPLGLTRTPDGIKGVVNRGRLEDLLDYYKILGVPDRDVILYSDEEEFTKAIRKLCRMINREIKRKKYISDIRITDHEYIMLRGYLHYAIMMLNKTGIAPDDAMFATAVTNVAIKVYKDGNFWGNFFKEIQLKQAPNTQKNIGIKFYEILEKYELVRGDAGEYVQNILMHCFVSDYYANSYFDFLFNFYRIDLERDLSRLDTDTMRAFMDSICSEENEGRTYMLVQHIGQAMAANRRGATIRIRNHMKLLDKFFWDDTFEITTTHRLYNLLQKWAKSSKDVIGEMEAYSTGRRRGAKRFSQPYIRYMGAENSFMLVIPPQSIKRIESEEIYWNVSGGINRKLDVELMESVIGYKVLESKFYIPFGNVLDSFQVELCTAEDQSIKKFSIRKQDVRFFDDDGYPINSNTIKTGEVTAVTRVGDIVRSSALYDSEEINGLLLSYFNFEFEDILHMPDGHVVIIGRPEITNSIAGKGRIEGAVCYMDERKYDLYGRVPYLVLRMKSSRFAGTAITINGKKQRLSDIEYESFTIDDKTDDVGYYVDLNNYLDGRDDVYRIDVDIPGGSSPHWEFVYIKDFAVEFDEAPYVFEPRGTVVFPEHIKIKEIEDFCEKEPGVNGYKFTIKEVSRTLDFVTSVGEHDVDISIPVPAFFIKNQNGEWDSNIPAPVWHADLPDVIDLAVPYHKVTLYMDDVFTDGSDSGRELTYRRNIGDDHILCDISKFKSYLTGDDIARQLRMRFGEVDSNLFTIIIHSKVISLQILGNFDTNDITVNADISGKADYYIDIRKGDETIAEKIPLIDGTARYNHEIGNGIYEVEVFELVDDDSGFGGEDYYSIGVYDQEMMNPYDMTDRSFKIIQVEEKGNPLAVLPIRYNYYVLDLKKTEDSHIYNGMMLVRKSFFKGSEIASFPVSVGFDDLNKPNYVWISFIDEYGDNTDFLYDTRKQGILQEENPMLRPMVCYRRYTFLNDEEYIYHIDFVIEHYSNDYDELSEMVDFPETDSTIVFKSHRYDSKHKRYEVDGDKKQSAAFFGNDILFVGDAPISPKSRMCLRDARIQTMNELTKMTKAEFAKLSSANIKIIRDIDSALKQYGMKFKEESE